MLPNTCVFALVPSSTRLKFESGAGEPVKLKLVGPFGVASLMTVIEPGKMTASAESERSWLPPAPSRLINRVWYGDPEIATAELFRPQSAREEMCPAHASTGFAWLAVKLIVIRADLSPAKPLPSGYE
jgi:hypothetical protein